MGDLRILIAPALLVAPFPAVAADARAMSETLERYLKSPIIAAFDDAAVPATAACPVEWACIPLEQVPARLEDHWMRSIGGPLWMVRVYELPDAVCGILESPERRGLSGEELHLLLRADAAMTRQAESGTAISPWQLFIPDQSPTEGETGGDSAGEAARSDS